MKNQKQQVPISCSLVGEFPWILLAKWGGLAALFLATVYVIVVPTAEVLLGLT